MQSNHKVQSSMFFDERSGKAERKVQSQKSFGRSELAKLYFPHLQQKSAWQKLRSWFQINPRLRPLASLTRRTFTPVEVAQIYAELGEP
jgi:hypothetical protein